MAAPADLGKLRIDRDQTPAPVTRAFVRNLIIALLAIVIIAIIVFVMRERAVPVIKVITVSASSGTSSGGGPNTSVTANGYVVARTKASVSAKTAGRLAFLGVSEGSYVQRGDIIARLDNADYEAAMAQAEANIATADASLIEATSDRDQLTREANRLRDVRTQNQMLVSQQELDVAVSRAAQGDARVNAALARKKAAEAGLRMAQANNDNTIIRAPFTGTVLRKDAEVGEVVAPSVGGGLTRGAVVTMADLATLEVEVDVNESYIARVKSGRATRITLDAYPDTAFRGTVRQVVPTADRQRATVQVKVTIADRDPRILPEMGAKVDFLEPDTARAPTTTTTASRQVFRLPATVFHMDAGSTVVWLVREGKLQRRSVTTGPVSAGFQEVRSGLSGGEQLLLSGVATPSEGMRVKVVP